MMTYGSVIVIVFMGLNLYMLSRIATALEKMVAAKNAKAEDGK
jgi:hypothetical protein